MQALWNDAYMSDATHLDSRPHWRRVLRPLGALLASMALAGCDVRDSVPVRSRTLVRVTTARMQARQISATLTGEVRARVQSDQSFRISGRVIERLVDVGALLHGAAYVFYALAMLPIAWTVWRMFRTHVRTLEQRLATEQAVDSSAFDPAGSD